MPRRNDIKKILLIGSGPIVIGQACEFDYSGAQACKALREEGYEVVLVNSNPATIMTDPEFADATYIEPITPEIVEKIIAKAKQLKKKQLNHNPVQNRNLKNRKRNKNMSNKLYKIEDNKIARLKKTCPRCGAGTYMADHKDRVILPLLRR